MPAQLRFDSEEVRIGVLAFAEFGADPERFDLCRAETIIDMSAKCFDVLPHLIRHREWVVSTAEVVERAW